MFLCSYVFKTKNMSLCSYVFKNKKTCSYVLMSLKQKIMFLCSYVFKTKTCHYVNKAK